MLSVVVLSVGCGDVEIGGTCGPGDPCGGGGTCDYTAPEGPTCVDPDGDDDADGLPNKRDFCQHQAGGAFDEDLDGRGDDCDSCPIAPPPATPDADGDEIESPCDPDPTVDGDRIVVFSGFNEAVPTTWKMTGTWTQRGGEILVTPTSPTIVETLTAPLPLSSNHVAILASYRVDAVDTTATENAASVIALDRRPAGVSTSSCGSSRTGGTDRLLLDTDLSNVSDDFTTLFDVAGLYRIAQKLDNAQAACAIISDRETGAVQAATSGNAPSEAGLSVRGATVKFQYLLVVQRAP